MKDNHPLQSSRRDVLKKTFALSLISVTGAAAIPLPAMAFSDILSKEERDKMTPDEIIEHFRQGNIRFRQNKPMEHDYLAQKRRTSSGQYPAAVILSCIDSRAPAEIVLDTGIGEVFIPGWQVISVTVIFWAVWNIPVLLQGQKLCLY